MSSHVNRAKWESMTLFGQMGNIGSEVGRALRAQARGNVQDKEAAAIRAYELFDLTAEVIDNTARLKEILRAREQFSLALENGDDKLEQYFLNFAIAERMRQLK